MSPSRFRGTRKVKLVLRSAVFVMVFIAISTPAPALEWIMRDLPGDPGPVWGHKAVMDVVTGRMIVQGGLLNGDEDEKTGTVWALSLATSVPTWSEFSTGAPLRDGNTLILDAPRRRLILFGGEDDEDNFTNDTWECGLDSPTPSWTTMTVSGIIPCIREDHTAIYDSRHETMAVHAGTVMSYGNETYDTWSLALNGTAAWAKNSGACSYQTTPPGPGEYYVPCSPYFEDWRFCNDLPQPRALHAMAFDSTADYVIVHGGVYLESSAAENWSTHSGHYSEGDWTEHAIATSPRHSHAIVFDSIRHRFLMYGGDTAESGVTSELDTLTAAHATWGELTADNGPPARAAHSAVYDPIYDRLVVYGGRLADNTADDKVWELRFTDTPEVAPDTLTIVSGARDSQGRVLLTWTSVGADDQTGRATSYDLRSSSSAITSGNWASATQVSGEPNPREPGVVEQFYASGCDSVYFAVKAIDAFGGSSVISNVVSVKFDTTGIRPAAPLLTAEHEGGNHSAVVYVTASGADSLVGWGKEYDLRRSLSRITSANFSSATQVSGEPAPGCVGSYDQINVSSLVNCKTYYFAVKERDAFGNWSAMSNLDSVDTFCSGGFSAPHEVSPVVFELGPAHPNPTNGRSTMQYGITVPQAGRPLDLAIFDAAGRLVRGLKHEAARPGRFEAVWDRTHQDGRRASAGIYFVRLSVGDELRTRAITLQ